MKRIFTLIKSAWGLQIKGPQRSPRSRPKSFPLPNFLLKKRRYNRQIPPARQWDVVAHLKSQWESVSRFEVNPMVLSNALLGLLVLTSAVSVVYASYENRQQVSALAELRFERDALQKEWTYLINDQNSLSEFSRIEKTASVKLNMSRPNKDDIYIIRSMGSI